MKREYQVYENGQIVVASIAASARGALRAAARKLPRRAVDYNMVPIRTPWWGYLARVPAGRGLRGRVPSVDSGDRHAPWRWPFRVPLYVAHEDPRMGLVGRVRGRQQRTDSVPQMRAIPPRQ